MFTPVHVELAYWFYPIGTMPAVNLFRDAPGLTQQEKVNILLLACGDPRNILFSLWCEQANGTNVDIGRLHASG